MTVDLGEGPIAVSIEEFKARLFQQEPDRTGDRATHLGIRALFTDTDRESAILGVIGGALVDVVIGTDRGTSPPVSTNSKSGVDPIPF